MPLLADALHVGAAVLDVLVVGGGPAGLSAALMLGRCRRRVLLCDAGTPRNGASRALHGLLSRDGTAPLDLLRFGREELVRYGVDCRSGCVQAVSRSAGGFRASLADGVLIDARVVLLATGVVDDLPAVDGLADCYGTSVHHCPYCDGWEWRDRRLAVYGSGRAAGTLALSLQTWSRDVVLFSDGPARVSVDTAARLREQGVRVEPSAVAHLEHDRGLLRRVVLATGAAIERDALFFTTGQHAQSTIARDLGCALTPRGTVKTDRHGATGVPGVFVVGDASRDVQFVVVAAAEGAKAAVAINRHLQAGGVPALSGG